MRPIIRASAVSNALLMRQERDEKRASERAFVCPLALQISAFRHARLHAREELQHDGGHAVEESGTEFAFKDVAEVARTTGGWSDSAPSWRPTAD